MKKERTQINFLVDGMNTIKIAFIYLIIGLSWIIFSDQIILSITQDASFLSKIQTTKGFFFVIVTSLILYYLIRKSTRRLTNEHNILSQIVDTVPVGIAFVNKEGQITFANKNAEKVLVLTKDKITSRTYNDPGWKITSLDGSPFPTEQLPFSIVQRSGKAVNNIEHAIEYSSGKRTLLSINAAPIKDKKNNFDGMISSIEDITERKKAEEEIKTKNEELQTLNKIIHKSIESIDLNFRLEYIMDEALKVVGLEGGTVCLINPDNTFDLAVHRETSQETINDLSEHKIKIGECLCGNCAKDCKPLILNSLEEVLEFATREILRGEDIRFHAAFPFVVSKKCVGVLCVFTRTDKKPTELSLKLLETMVAQTAVLIENASLYENLKESEEKFSTIFKAAPGSMILSSLPDGKTVEVNNNFSLITGYSIEEALGKTTGDLVMWADPSERDRFLSILQTDGVVQNFEADLNHKSGTIRNGLLSGHILTIHDKKYLLGTFYDITERKQAEQKLLASEIRYRRLFESSKDGILILDADTGIIVNVNPFLIEMLGYSKENLIEKTIWEIGFFKDIVVNKDKFLELQQKEYARYEDLPLETSDGHSIHVEFVSNVYLVGHQKVIQCNIRDITERKRAEEKLLKSEHMLSESQRIGNIGGWSWDLSGPIKWTDETYNLYGVSPKTFTPTVESLINLIHPVDRSTMQQWIEDCAAGKKSDELVFRTLLPDGSIRFLNGRGELIYDAKNKTKLISGTVQDITERKKAEEEINKSRDELHSLTAHLQTVREEERANLAREMHDEIGQILTSIKMNLSLMTRQLETKEKKFQKNELDKEIKSMSKMVDHAVVRVRKMITELRPELLDKLGLIPALEWYVDEFEKETKIKSEFKCDFEELSLDRNKELTIFRIVQEALTNVTKHSKADKVKVNLNRTGEGIFVEISDNGIGVSEKQQRGEKSFGLLGMRERANLFGGKLEITGVEGKGTTVKLVI